MGELVVEEHVLQFGSQTRIHVNLHLYLYLHLYFPSSGCSWENWLQKGHVLQFGSQTRIRIILPSGIREPAKRPQD